MSHLSRGKASSGFSKSDIGMDASDCKEINICDMHPPGVKIVRRSKKYSLSPLRTTKMSHFVFSPAGCRDWQPPRTGMVICHLRHAPVSQLVSETGHGSRLAARGK
jgi:hypothetical protein